MAACLDMGRLVGYPIIIVMVTVCTPSLSIDDKMYEASGVVCYKCPPGTMVEKHCTQDFANSTCTQCPDHEFMNAFNSKSHCKACKPSCPKNGQEVQKCSSTTNRVCRCDRGFHRYPVDPIDEHYKCEPHTRCGPGHGVKTSGNHSHDTECEPCLEGLQFLNTSDPDRPRCQNCSLCLPDRDIISNCTLTADTVCSTNGTDNGTTSQPLPADGSDGLGGGYIALIVIVCLLVIVLVVGIIIHKRRGIPQICERCRGRETETVKAPAAVPLLVNNWSDAFIERKVFPYLSRNLGEEWQSFVMQLPGWPTETSIKAVIDHKREEETAVPNMILGCLSEWKKQAGPQANKENILTALRAVEKADLVERLQQLSTDSPSFQENGV